MKKKNCELCVKNKAKMYCESDQASLCWDCDWKVHSANFLVAKHSRNLLCHSCQNQTPWSASGPKLSPTLTLCNSCLKNPTAAVQLPDPIEEIEEENYQMETDNEEDDSSENESSENEIDEDNEYGDGNQVVPLSSSSPSSTFSPPSPVRSVSSSGSYGDLSVAGEEEGDVAVAVNSSPWKRVRQSDCLSSEDEENKGKSSSNRVVETNEGATNK
ncbi:zinc finger protein CONSTANS-like [Solanum dulcamara]|uniref:zinc finger protein CONSTANS-like n=1 Tax=Solanum dulcamara TaxID=45834 RepID=UPI00248531C4|nr:zinc finger protein CONSTANS-like [Solanum dulcamara]